MKQQFLNEYLECVWLRQTHLYAFDMPAPWGDFRSFVILGNEDAPDSVELYLSNDPLYRDDFFVVDFAVLSASGVYDGRTRELKSQP